MTDVGGSSYGTNTTGNYASDIKYRAWGSIKQSDYDSPDGEQIRLSYDNRLRVNHHEVAVSQATSGYTMKADFSYSADNRVQAKDDLLDNKWDRTMKYDQAGGLTYNQFGLEFGTTGERVYEQSIEYGAFSQITSRNGMHWGNEIGFTATYLNGRKQNSLETYDSSGNIVHVPGDSSNDFQKSYFDASGRRTTYIASRVVNSGGQGGFDVIESQYEYVFDGDGRPVTEKSGWRNTARTPVRIIASRYRSFSGHR